MSPKIFSLFFTIFISSPLLLYYLCYTTIYPIPTLINTKSTTIQSPPPPSPQPPPQIPPPIKSPPPPQPPPAKEDDDDEELIRLASQVSPHPSPNKPKKLAFMFLTTTPLPLAPLWESYFLTNQNNSNNTSISNLFNIYIHADPSVTSDPPFSGVFANHLIPSRPTQRGSPSLVSATRRLLSRALLHDSANSFFILLSPSCIPLHSFNFTYNTLITSNPKNMSFVEIDITEPKKYNLYKARGVDVMLPQIPFERFRVGSQFFILNRKHARLVIKDTLVWSKFKLPCLSPKVCYPEEHYFSTLLSMEDPAGCVPATLTHVDWSQRRSHPYTYRKSDVRPELIDLLKGANVKYGNGGVPHNGSHWVGQNHTFLFARKFSPECLDPLMSIAQDDVMFIT